MIVGELKAKFAEWQDLEVAMEIIGLMLGLVEGDYTKEKWVYWTNNPTSKAMTGILEQLVSVKILLRRDPGKDEACDPKFKFNDAFKPIEKKKKS